MKYYGTSLNNLIGQLNSLPGVGAKSAQRLAFHIINLPDENFNLLINTIKDAKTKIKYCSVCCNLTDVDPCPICSSAKREVNTIMVVEDPRNMAAYEKTAHYKGLYHVLHGAISPMSGVNPSDIKIKELLNRLKSDEVDEIILATNPTIEGEATAMYLSKLIKPLDIKVTRIANGVPVGSDLEYIDQVTLSRALDGRIEM